MFAPSVFAGAVQARFIQSLKALTILGVDGGPGYAKEIIKCATKRATNLNAFAQPQCIFNLEKTHPLFQPGCYQSLSCH